MVKRSTLIVISFWLSLVAPFFSAGQETGPETAFTKIEEMPVYPGGDLSLMEFFANNTIYPKKALDEGITGVSYVSYIVEKDGTIGDVRVTQGSHPLLDAAGVQVVRKIKGYKPGKQDGKPVRVQFTVPIRFHLILPPHSPQEKFEEAKALFEEGKDEKAMALLNKAIEKGESWYIEAYKYRAELYFGMNELDLALSDYQKAIDLDNRRTDLWIGKAKCLYTKGEFVVAIQNLLIAARTDTLSSKPFSIAGDYCFESDKFGEAEGFYSKGIAINNRSGYLFLQRGKSKQAQDKNVEACEDWNQALNLKETEARPLVNEHCSN